MKVKFEKDEVQLLFASLSQLISKDKNVSKYEYKFWIIMCTIEDLFYKRFQKVNLIKGKTMTLKKIEIYALMIHLSALKIDRNSDANNIRNGILDKLNRINLCL